MEIDFKIKPAYNMGTITRVPFMKAKGSVVKYREIADLLIGRIDSGEFKQNELIPPEVQLAREFKVSRITMRNALSMLVNEGLLVRRAGRGTIVASRESKFLKLRNGMNIGTFTSSPDPVSSRMYRGLVKGLNDWGGNLCVFPFQSDIDQPDYVQQIIGKNIVDGIILPFFGAYHKKIIGIIKEARIPFLEISSLSHYEKMEYGHPFIYVDEIFTLQREFARFREEGIRRIHLLGTENRWQMHRMWILLEMAKLDKSFDFIEFITVPAEAFQTSKNVIMKSLNCPDTLIFISGDELLPYFDAAMQTLTGALPGNMLKPVAYLHYEDNDSERWKHRFSCFERPFYELGLQAAGMMKEIFCLKEQNVDFYQNVRTSLKSVFIPAQ